MSKLLIGESLRYGQEDTPTREGEVINCLEEIYNIPTPYVGMRVYCKEKKMTYTITSLASEIIGGEEVFNKVGTFEADVKKVTWVNEGNVSDMNDFTEAGVYDIIGEHKRNDDNLPIANTGGGHTFSARLTVLDSSIGGNVPGINNGDKCITQILSLCNRLGQGEVYVRTGKGSRHSKLTWEKWSTLQRNVNVGRVDSLDGFIDNGIYSGVFEVDDTALTFVLVVINDYVVGVAPRRVSQFLYALGKVDGAVTFTYRTRTGEDDWSEWKIVNDEEIGWLIRDKIKDVVDGVDPDRIDSIKDIITWIENHGDVESIINDIKKNSTAISNETSRAQKVELNLSNDIESVKKNALQYNKIGFSSYADKVELYAKNVSDNAVRSADIPAATAEKAGVMTASDKAKLDAELSVKKITSESGLNFDSYTTDGVYNITVNSNAVNSPVLSTGGLKCRLTVLANAGDEGDVVTQVANVNNRDGGEGNVYIRSRQGSKWSKWGKMQTNVEVGQVKSFDDLRDNGMYSGVLTTTGETFVLIVINNYAVATQAGYGSYISQLKYSVDLQGNVEVKTRRSDAYGYWSVWMNLQGQGGGGGVAELMEEVTYSELVALRDNSSLVAGMKYRITNYVTTTVQKDTKSANHPFDVIVEAISENELSELAQAIQHKGDTYFNGNNLSAWQLWYDLDNNTDKYTWADAENGKGVIYYMKDERDNECPYDFKNIMFEDYFTFSYSVNGVIYDGTVRSEVKNCYGNIIKQRKLNGVQNLNSIVFKNTAFGYYCYNNTFGYYCYNNTFGYNCNNNTFGNDCNNNTFGNDCNNNNFGNNCNNNNFGNNCNNNNFGYYCYNNTFGNDCYNNNFGNNCYANNFGDGMSNRQINSQKTSITLNEEYYDDGTNALVPIKHPDISTQPSILPYKFMGQYVYEQLIPNIEISNSFDIQNTFAVKKPLIISANSIGGNASNDATPNWWIGENTFNIETSTVADFNNVKFFRIVYTSMPEEGDNYGYNNY